MFSKWLQKGCYGAPQTGRTESSALTRNSVGAGVLDLFYRTIMLSVGAGFYPARGRGRAPPLRTPHGTDRTGRTGPSAPARNSVGADAYIGPPHRSPCNVSLRGRSAPVAIRPPHALAGTLRPYSKITAPLFFSASPLRISASVSSNPSFVCSPVAMSLQATTPAAISSSPKKITYGTPILSA